MIEFEACRKFLTFIDFWLYILISFQLHVRRYEEEFELYIIQTYFHPNWELDYPRTIDLALIEFKDIDVQISTIMRPPFEYYLACKVLYKI